MRNFSKWTQMGASESGSTITIDASGNLATLTSAIIGPTERAYLRRVIAAVPRSVVTVRVLARNISGSASIIIDYPAASSPVRTTNIASPDLIEYVTNWQVPAAATTESVLVNIGVFTSQIGSCEIYDAKIEVDGIDIDTVVDWLVEEGSNASGSFSKFASGLMICRKTVSGVGPISQVWGSGFDSPYVILGNWAAPFAGDPPQRSVSSWNVTGSSSFVVGVTQPTLSRAGQVRLARLTSSGSTEFGVDVVGIGRWFT